MKTITSVHSSTIHNRQHGCSSWGRWGSGTTERVHFHFSLSCIGEGNGNPLQCSCLENPRDGEPGGLPSMGSHRVGHDWSDLAAAAAGSCIQLLKTTYVPKFESIVFIVPKSIQFKLFFSSVNLYGFLNCSINEMTILLVLGIGPGLLASLSVGPRTE